MELVGSRGTTAATVGRTDINGAFAASFAADETARLQKLGQLLPRVLDAAGKEVLLGKDAVVLAPGVDVQITLTLPVRVVPRSVVVGGTVIFGQADPKTDPKPDPQPGVRTPLEKLDVDDAMRKRLRAGGIADVEAIVDADTARLIEVAGDRQTAVKLREMATALLGGAKPRRPAGKGSKKRASKPRPE